MRRVDSSAFSSTLFQWWGFFLRKKKESHLRKIFQGCYSETGVHIVMDRNFVCLWRRHNCNWSQFHFLRWSLVSTKRFLQSSELGPPHHPLTRRRGCPLLVPGGGDTLACGRGGWGGPNFDEGTDTVKLKIYNYFVEDTFRFAFLLATKIGTSFLGNHLTLKEEPDLRYSQQWNENKK